MIKITNKILKRLKKISSPSRRARYVHKEINQQLDTLFKDPVVKKHIACHKGCSACCHTQVSITDDEAILLAKLVESGVSIDMEKLKTQSAASENSAVWYQIPYEKRGCVFLDENRECSIYDDRPAVCRTNHVVGNPQDCSTKSGEVNRVQLLNTFDADMVTVAGFASCKENGALPSLLYKHLKEDEIENVMTPQKGLSQVFKEI